MPGQSHLKSANAKKPLAKAADVIYIYDGSLPGFFCCVHECVYSGEIPAEIFVESSAQPSLFAQKHIQTCELKAKKVEISIGKKISPRATEVVQRVFLSCLEAKELALLHFLLLGYQEGGKAPYMLGHNHVKTVLQAEKHLMGEVHLLKGFVRFADYGNVLGASISPKNFVLPFLQSHFVQRYCEENFIIYDKTHKAALIYENRKSRIVPLSGICFDEISQKEQQYQSMWKRFYNTIAIEERTNHKCRQSHMPKRYWENMLEVKDLL